MGVEFLTVYWRDMVKFFRLKAMLFATLIQPIVWLALFGPAMANYFENNMMEMAAIPGTVSVDYLTFMSVSLFRCFPSIR